jgi:hypothetical protein
MRTKEFYDFMVKRENIRLKKEAKLPWPWTDDKILQTYKFTNVKREHDHTTRWMRKHWTKPNELMPLNMQLFNCALFRYFGTIEFAKVIGWQTNWEKSDQGYVKNAAKERLSCKKKVFTGAYVITNQGIAAPKQEVVVDKFLTPFHKACPKLTIIARKTSRWQAVAEEMMKLQGFGGSGFMTKEILQDAIHTPVFQDCIDLDTWCPIGPGARRGLARVYGLPVKTRFPGADGLSRMINLFDERVDHWPKDMVKLELHDIQFQLCEFDKYERVKLGEGRPRSKYKSRGKKDI